MKTIEQNVVIGGSILLMALTAQTMWAQGPLITALGQNGQLTATNLTPGSGVTVEWASEVAGPWQDTWQHLQNVVVESNGTVDVGVPMFYRVREANPDPARFVWIRPGTFMMGSPTNEAEYRTDEVLHQVTLTEGFWMGRYEVTQAEYEALMGTNPSQFIGPDLPVDQVSWDDATNYCSQLTAQESAAGRLFDGYVYRLPTEAEWEYACRAGTTTAFHYGAALVSGMANFYGFEEYVSTVGRLTNATGIYVDQTTPIGSYEPNPWGLYDMHGNIFEWCLDWYGSYDVQQPVVDPVGPTNGTERVRRGGSWFHFGFVCKSAKRGGSLPTNTSRKGLRVVLGRPLN